MQSNKAIIIQIMINLNNLLKNHCLKRLIKRYNKAHFR